MRTGNTINMDLSNRYAIASASYRSRYAALLRHPRLAEVYRIGGQLGIASVEIFFDVRSGLPAQSLLRNRPTEMPSNTARSWSV